MNNYQNLKGQNYFYDNINNFIQSKSEKTILTTLDEIGGDPLTVNQLRLIGSIAYLIGIDFVSQGNEPNKIVLTNVNKRLEAAKLNKTIVDKFFDTITKIEQVKLEPAKESIKNRINEKIDSKDAVELVNIQLILKDLSVPVDLSLDINKIINTNVITYHQLLMFNSIIYERADLSGSVVNNKLLPLLRKKQYGENISKASQYFEDQKYAIIYFDSVVTLTEYLLSDVDNKSWLFNQEFIDSIKDVTPEQIHEEVKEFVDEHITTEVKEDLYPYQNADLSGPVDQFIAGLLNSQLYENFEGRVIETPMDMFEALDFLVKNEEDTLSNMYLYMKKNQDVNRIDISEVFPGMDLVTFNKYLDIKLNELKDKYQSAVEEYISPIEGVTLSKVITTVHELILNITITNDAETKAYLIQQLAENQIETYKQLHQVAELIESCMIQGSNIIYYKAFYDMIKGDANIVRVFENSNNIDSSKLMLQAFAGLHDFYNRPKAGEEQLIVK